MPAMGIMLAVVSGAGTNGIPANAIVDESGQAITDELGNIITDDT